MEVLAGRNKLMPLAVRVTTTRDLDPGPPDQHFEVWGTCWGSAPYLRKNEGEAIVQELVAPIFLNDRTCDVHL